MKKFLFTLIVLFCMTGNSILKSQSIYDFGSQLFSRTGTPITGANCKDGWELTSSTTFTPANNLSCLANMPFSISFKHLARMEQEVIAYHGALPTSSNCPTGYIIASAMHLPVSSLSLMTK